MYVNFSQKNSFVFLPMSQENRDIVFNHKTFEEMLILRYSDEFKAAFAQKKNGVKIKQKLWTDIAERMGYPNQRQKISLKHKDLVKIYRV